MKNIRSQFGDIPTYFTFDMDALDPTSCPGAGEQCIATTTASYCLTTSILVVIASGSLEVAGLTPIQAMEIVQGLKGLNIVGGDIAEVSGVTRVWSWGCGHWGGSIIG